MFIRSNNMPKLGQIVTFFSIFLISMSLAFSVFKLKANMFAEDIKELSCTFYHKALFWLYWSSKYCLLENRPKKTLVFVVLLCIFRLLHSMNVGVDLTSH